MNEDLSDLNLIELLDLLEPVVAPPPVSLLPQTTGWLWLLAVLLAGVGLVLPRIIRHRRSNGYRRVAESELKRVKSDPAAIAAIMRRTALVAFPRQDVASLHGDAWLAFLDQSYDGNQFRTGPGRALASAPYRPNMECPGLTDAAIRWVRQHRGAGHD